MGLYDNRLAELSAPRRSRRVAQRSSVVSEAPRKPMRAQSLLFGRDAGWTAVTAKAWAKSHGYKYGKVDVTDQYFRIRQFDPKSSQVKRTITLGRGIRAVVAREENMAAKKRRAKASPRRRARKSATATPRRAKRRVRAAEAPKRRRRARRRPGTTMMEAKRPRKRRRAKRSVARAWRGNSVGHAKAARKGHRRRKARRRTTRESFTYEARKPRRRRAKRRVHAVSESPRRHRSSRRRRHSTHEARRHTRRRRVHSVFAKRGGGSGGGMTGVQFGLALVSGGVGFVLADAVDRLLATYNPDPTKADPAGPPKDKFTSNGAGTLANTLNLANSPNVMRIGAGIGLTALPAIGSMFVKNPMLRSSLEGLAIGSGVKLFSLFWNNVVVPHLLMPKDTTAGGLQKSVIARLYPAEIAAAINVKASPLPQQVSSAGSGALSGPPQQTAGVGAPVDVGPFALAGSSEYPDAAQALRQQAGISGSAYPSMQNVWGTGGDSGYPTAAQAMGIGDTAVTADSMRAVSAATAHPAVQDMAATVAAVLPGVTPTQAVHAAASAATSPQDIVAALHKMLPHVSMHKLYECARHLHPHVARLHPHLAVPAPAAPAAPLVPSAGTPVAPVVLQTAPLPPVTATGVSYQPGPPESTGPGPQAAPHADCGCIGDDNPFLGFIGDSPDETLYDSGKAA